MGNGPLRAKPGNSALRDRRLSIGTGGRVVSRPGQDALRVKRITKPILEGGRAAIRVFNVGDLRDCLAGKESKHPGSGQPASRPDTPQDRLRKATAALKAILADGPLPSSVARTRAREKGVPQTRFYRVCRKIGVERVPQVGKGGWLLRLPNVRGEVESADDFLRRLVKKGPILVAHVMEERKRLGYSKSLLFKARRRLRLAPFSYKVGQRRIRFWLSPDQGPERRCTLAAWQDGRTGRRIA